MHYYFYDMERISLASAYGSSTHKYVLLKKYFVDDTHISMTNTKGESLSLNISDIASVYLTQDFFSSQIRCYVRGSDGTNINFGDHSYKMGPKNIAEVNRNEFKLFIEEVNKKIINNGTENNVSFTFRGPDSIKMELLSMMVSFLLPILVLSAFSIFLKTFEFISPIIMTISILTLFIPTMLLGLFMDNLLLDPFRLKGKYDPDEFPVRLFDIANAEITRKSRAQLEKTRIEKDAVKS